MRLKKDQTLIQNLSSGYIAITRKINVPMKTSKITIKDKDGNVKVYRESSRLLNVKEIEVLWPIQEEITRLNKSTQGKMAQNFDLAKREMRGKYMSPKQFLEMAQEMIDDNEMEEDEIKKVELFRTWLTQGYDIVEPAARRIRELKTVLRRTAKAHMSDVASQKKEADKLVIRAKRREERLEEIAIDKELEIMSEADESVTSRDLPDAPVVIVDDVEEAPKEKKKKRKKLKVLSDD